MVYRVLTSFFGFGEMGGMGWESPSQRKGNDDDDDDDSGGGGACYFRACFCRVI
jgi:hypothetical protein